MQTKTGAHSRAPINTVKILAKEVSSKRQAGTRLKGRVLRRRRCRGCNWKREQHATFP